MSLGLLCEDDVIWLEDSREPSPSSAAEVLARFESLGVCLSADWLRERDSASCDAIFQTLLTADLRECIDRVRQPPLHPPGPSTRVAPGSHLLQVCSALNVSRPSTDSGKIAGGVLHLTLSDGASQYSASLLDSVPGITSASSVGGLKLIVAQSPPVRRGVVLLRAHNVSVLGGACEDLVAVMRKREADHDLMGDPLSRHYATAAPPAAKSPQPNTFMAVVTDMEGSVWALDSGSSIVHARVTTATSGAHLIRVIGDRGLFTLTDVPSTAGRSLRTIIEIHSGN